MQKTKIILASASIGRKGLLEKLKVPFEVLLSTIDEEKIADSDPYTRIQNRARAKAEDVARLLSERSREPHFKETSRLVVPPRSKNKSTNHELPTMNYLIFAADSEALLNGKTFGKSKDRAHAKKIITTLMGHTHEFLTATCIIHLQNNQEMKRWEDITKTYVSMKKMTKSEIDAYVHQYDFSRFAAAYTLNETPWDLITKIDGSYTSVIGLPFEVFLPILRKYNLI